MTALTSLVTDTPVNPEYAMTGEVSLRGGVMPIGGLPGKTDGSSAGRYRKKYLFPQKMREIWKK